MSRTFEYNIAVRRQSPLVLGIMGPSGGGKTYSGLRLATGIQRISGGDVAVVDTETGRALKYCDYFTFKHVPFTPPYRSLDYLEVGQHCIKMGAKTIIYDSATHEHAGIGGYLEYADAELDRMAGDNYGKRQACKLASFIKPGADRRKMIDGLLALDANLIFCFRAKEKVKPLKDAAGKTEITNIGFMPIGSTELVFEMDACCLLLPHAGGVPTWISDEVGEKMMIKTAKQFDGIFAKTQPLSEEIGQSMAEWARGGAVRQQAPAALTDLPEGWDAWSLEMRGDNRSHKGSVALQAWWTTLSTADKKALKPKLDKDWKPTADAVKAEQATMPV